jgi:hypothetical protein
MNRPSDATTANLVERWERTYGKPVYQGADGKLYELDASGNPIPYVAPAPSYQTDPYAIYTDPYATDSYGYAPGTSSPASERSKMAFRFRLEDAFRNRPGKPLRQRLQVACVDRLLVRGVVLDGIGGCPSLRMTSVARIALATIGDLRDDLDVRVLRDLSCSVKQLRLHGVSLVISVPHGRCKRRLPGTRRSSNAPFLTLSARTRSSRAVTR